MKTTIILVMFALLDSTLQGAKTPDWVNTGWVEEEGVLLKVLSIRAKELQKRTGCGFKENDLLKVNLEWSLGGYRGNSTDAEYKAETQTINFVIRRVYELNVKYKPIPLRLMDPKIVAEDDSLGRLADHELGHAIVDQTSRRVGMGPFFTVKHFNELSPDEQLGLNILGEGIATWFESVRYPTRETLSEVAFPSTAEEARFYSYDMITLCGGHWLVKDVLSMYGERGLEWLVRHPFVANSSNMREAAIRYRKRALTELAPKFFRF